MQRWHRVHGSPVMFSGGTIRPSDITALWGTVARIRAREGNTEGAERARRNAASLSRKGGARQLVAQRERAERRQEVADGKRAKALEVQTAVLGHLKVAQAAPEHIGGGQWQTAGEIATRLGRPRSSVSSALNSLKLDNLVEWRQASAGKSWLEYRAVPDPAGTVPDAHPEREVLVTPREELMKIVQGVLAEQLSGLRPALERLVREVVQEEIKAASAWPRERERLEAEMLVLRANAGALSAIRDIMRPLLAQQHGGGGGISGASGATGSGNTPGAGGGGGGGGR